MESYDVKPVSYFFQVDCDDLAVVDEPGALLHLDLVVKLALQDGRVSFQAHLQRAPLDVHHHIPALNAEVDIKRHCQLKEDDKNSSCALVLVLVTNLGLTDLFLHAFVLLIIEPGLSVWSLHV